jgi:hypothetical protein
LFVFGAWCGFGGGPQFRSAALSRPVTMAAVAWLVFAFLIAMTWHVPSLEQLVPKALIRAIYPIDKSNFDPLRLTHFGVFLSFAAHWILVQIVGGALAQLMVGIVGIVLLVGIAWLATWYRSLPTLFAVPSTVVAEAQ